MPDQDICKHCDKRIVLRSFARGDKWIHQTVNASFGDYNIFCKLSVAEPKEK